jgi:hypothetical protein
LEYHTIYWDEGQIESICSTPAFKDINMSGDGNKYLLFGMPIRRFKLKLYGFFKGKIFMTVGWFLG